MVAALLEQPAEDTGDLAVKIIEALDAKRAKDDTHWAIVMQWQDVIQMVGTFSTRRKAEMALTQLSSPGPGPSRAVIRQVRSLDSVTAGDRLL